MHQIKSYKQYSLIRKVQACNFLFYFWVKLFINSNCLKKALTVLDKAPSCTTSQQRQVWCWSHKSCAIPQCRRQLACTEQASTASRQRKKQNRAASLRTPTGKPIRRRTRLRCRRLWERCTHTSLQGLFLAEAPRQYEILVINSVSYAFEVNVKFKEFFSC